MAKDPPSQELLTAKEVAGLWRVTDRTVWRWVELGRLTPVRIGGTYRFKRSDVLQSFEKYEHGDPDQDRRRNDPSMG